MAAVEKQLSSAGISSDQGLLQMVAHVCQQGNPQLNRALQGGAQVSVDDEEEKVDGAAAGRRQSPELASPMDEQPEAEASARSALAGCMMPVGKCRGAPDKLFPLSECHHQACTGCLRDYLLDELDAGRAVGVRCPTTGCAAEISTSDIQRLLTKEDFERYCEATLMALINSDNLTFMCPNKKCGNAISMQPFKGFDGPVPPGEKDADGKVLSHEAYLHFLEFRLRCPTCSTIFCASCKTQPYHKGFTCSKWKEFETARHCRFCSAQLTPASTARDPPSRALADVCTEEECVAKRDTCCTRFKPCGCPCNGVRDEAESDCLPCLRHDLDIAEDFCSICYVEALQAAPCIQMFGACKHVFHFSCVKDKIAAGWPGARIGFDFRMCPLCKNPMQHPSLNKLLKPILELEAAVHLKAVERLHYEERHKDAEMKAGGEYYNKPEAYAMKLFLFYTCYTCKKPYFAGGYQCQEAGDKFDPKELICPSCQPSNASTVDCPTHGKDWLVYKCRYCCNVANWFCWGNTHFCDACHKSGVWQSLAHFRTGKNKQKIWQYPQCPGLRAAVKAVAEERGLSDEAKEAKCEKLLSDPTSCPLHARHPPAGFQFGLGCSMCTDKKTHALESAKKEGRAAALQPVRELLALNSTQGIRFIHHGDFDTNGLLYWLGTLGGMQPWANPAEAGTVKTSSSSIMEDSMPHTAICGRELVRCVTNWFIVDLIDMQLRPTYYSLKHYSSWDTECLRNWVFEGSNNGIQWTPLAVHQNDQSLDAKGATKTWQLPLCTQRYRMFRVFLTGRNSNNNHYLSLSGMELYGDLFMDSLGADGAAVDSMPVTPKRDFRWGGDQSAFDKQGIMHFLGTNMGAAPAWKNPCDLGICHVSCSELIATSGSGGEPSQPANAVVGRDAVRCVSAAKPSMWFAVDLFERRVLPIHYTLRHYSSWDTEALRHWLLQGSNDAKNWTTIKEHKGDEALHAAGAFHTWPLTCAMAYSKFRILQNGPNSNKHHFLALSGFELYGSMYEPPPSMQGQASPPGVGSIVAVLKYQSDFDTNGLFYRLGSNGGARPWSNPAETIQGSLASLLVKCSASSYSLNPPSQPAAALCGRDTVRCVTLSRPNQWFMLELITCMIQLTHYSLKHYSSWDGECLRSWRLEGSHDGFYFELIRAHVNDMSLNGVGSTATWPVSCKQPYRMFRIVSTGPNSNNNEYLALSGVELYGTMVSLTSGPPAFAAASAAAAAAVPASAGPALQQAPGQPGGQGPRSVSPPNNAPPVSLPLPPGAQGPGGGAQPLVSPSGAARSVISPSAAGGPVGAPAGPPPGRAQSPAAAAAALAWDPPILGSLFFRNRAGPQNFREGMSFEYIRDFDENGILFYIGSNQYSNSWQNPAVTGRVSVASSPLGPGEPAAAITGRAMQRCLIAPMKQAGAFFIIDLQQWWVKPSAYSLRHPQAGDVGVLREWQLLASKDGAKWTELVSHKKDDSLSQGTAATWQIPKIKKSYKFFKILQTGKNSVGQYNFALCGFELYGELYTKRIP